MRKVEMTWIRFRRDGENADHVEPEVGEVGECFLAQRLVVKLGPDHPQTAQGSGACPIFCQRRGRQNQFCADGDLLNLPTPGEHDGDRAPDLQRKLTQRLRQLRRQNFVVRHTTPIQALDRRNLTSPQSCRQPIQFRNTFPPTLPAREPHYALGINVVYGSDSSVNRRPLLN